MGEIPTYDPNRFTLPDNYLIAIGKLTYQWGILESTMDLAIRELFGFELYDPKPAMLVTHMSWPQRMDALESIINHLKDDYSHLARFPEIKPLLKKAQEGRNRIAHAKLSVNQEKKDEVLLLSHTSRGKLRTFVEPISVADIDSIAPNLVTLA